MATDRIVHIVDDEEAVRRSLERLLATADLHSIAYATPLAFLQAADASLAGCILLDIGLPGMSGLELQARLNERNVRAPIIVLTGHGDVATAVRAMKAGAFDFMEKPFDGDRLISAIEAALDQAATRRPVRETTEAAQKIAALTPREREVLEGLVAGRPNKVIAHDLGISVRTVEAHRIRMLERLGARHLAEAIRLAVLAAD